MHFERGVLICYNTIMRILGLFIVGVIVAWSPVVSAREISPSIEVDAATARRGYTFVREDGVAQLEVRPGMITEDVRLQILDHSPIAVDHLPKSYTVASPYLEVSIASVAEPHRSMFVRDPYVISMRVDSTTSMHTTLWLYDGAKEAWVRLPTTVSKDKKWVSARVHHSFVRVVALKRDTVVEGKGSWYRDRRADSAASNDFPIGSRLRVTDKQTNRSVVVVVRSRGPFVPGRVIDLSRTSFARLRPVRTGIGDFRVELISTP
jgi:hypothetical protein